MAGRSAPLAHVLRRRVCSPSWAAALRPAVRPRCNLGFVPARHFAGTASTVRSAATAVVGDASHAPRPELDFRSPEVAFESKSTPELLRTWFVFQVCSLKFVVRHCEELHRLSCSVLGSSLTHLLMRHSIFAHFCAGENVDEVVRKMAHLRQYGVGGILDYAAEAKDEAPPKAAQAAEGEVGATLSAKSWEYQGEKTCDANAEIFLDAIRAVRDATPDGFAAIKLSGLGDPKLLERMSSCLLEMARLFTRVSSGQDCAETQSYYCIDRSCTRLDFESFKRGWRALFRVEGGDAELRETFAKLDLDGDGVISFAEWAESLPLLSINELCRGCIEEGPLSRAALNETEVALYRNLQGRVHRILDLAQELKVRVMVDAEWLDIQPAIDHLVLELQRDYNKGQRPVVFQTYQTYLKGMHGSVLRDLERSRREGWRFGAKVVRGAYMVSEREKAERRGCESPVCDGYEATEQNFHAAIDSILSHNAQEQGRSGPEAEVLIASHNQGSIEFTLQRMAELGKDRHLVHFGQLLGMADHLTFTLGVNGYKAYKYVPYGPIDEVLPYLIRRTQENSTLLGSPGVQQERQMVGREVRRRLLGF